MHYHVAPSLRKKSNTLDFKKKKMIHIKLLLNLSLENLCVWQQWIVGKDY
jgi:hypothetical protein